MAVMDKESMKKEIERLKTALEEVVETFEDDHYDWYTNALQMANKAALAIGKEKVRFDTGGYFIPAKNGRDIKCYRPHN